MSTKTASEYRPRRGAIIAGHDPNAAAAPPRPELVRSARHLGRRNPRRVGPVAIVVLRGVARDRLHSWPAQRQRAGARVCSVAMGQGARGGLDRVDGSLRVPRVAKWQGRTACQRFGHLFAFVKPAPLASSSEQNGRISRSPIIRTALHVIDAASAALDGTAGWHARVGRK